LSGCRLAAEGYSLSRHSARFGGDPNRIILIGHSAGATHVAGTEIDIRDDDDLGMPEPLIVC